MRCKKSLYKRSSCTTLVRSCSHVAGTVGKGGEAGEVGKQGWRSGKSTQLPPESFAVQVPASKSYVGRVWVWLSFLVRQSCLRGFFTVLRFSHPQPTLQNPDSKWQFDLECTNTFKRVTRSSWVFCGLNNPQIRVRMRKSDWYFINITGVLWPSARRKKLTVHTLYILLINQEWGHYKEISDEALLLQGRGLRFLCNDWTDKVNKLLIIWPFHYGLEPAVNKNQQLASG